MIATASLSTPSPNNTELRIGDSSCYVLCCCTLMSDSAVTVSVAHSTLLNIITSDRFSVCSNRKWLKKLMQADSTMNVNSVPSTPKKLMTPRF